MVRNGDLTIDCTVTTNQMQSPNQSIVDTSVFS